MDYATMTNDVLEGQMSLEEVMQEMQKLEEKKKELMKAAELAKQAKVFFTKDELEEISKKFKESNDPEAIKDFIKFLGNYGKTEFYNFGEILCYDENSVSTKENRIATESDAGTCSKIIYWERNGYCGRTFFLIAPVADDNGGYTLYGAKIELHMKYIINGTHNSIEKISCSWFKKWTKFAHNSLLLIKDVKSFINRQNPYLKKFCDEKNLRYDLAIQFPQIEQLEKAGFKMFLKRILDLQDAVFCLSYRFRFSASFAAMSRLLSFKPTNGKLKKCFKDSQGSTYKLAKIMNEYDNMTFEKWDNIRKMVNTGKITSEDDVRLIVEMNLDKHTLELVNAILGASYHGKKIFSLSSLMNYLRRIDLNEAIGQLEGLQLLKDYLQACQYCNAEPRIDGDSLKREHDVMARNSRRIRDERIASGLKKRCAENEKYNYSDDTYIIRSITDYDDLIREANEQHNCVASYANMIASGRSLIFTMQYKNSNRSLVTVELSPDGKTIRQKFLAYNQKIRSKSMSEFLEKWLVYVSNMKKGAKTNSKSISVDITNNDVEEEVA